MMMTMTMIMTRGMSCNDSNTAPTNGNFL